MQFRKPELIPLLFIVAATLTTGGLGAWQVQRLMWKNDLIAQIEQAQSQPALTDMTDEAYRKVMLKGKFISDKAARVIGRPQWAQGSGYFQLAPFTLKNGKTVLVNRGWAPADWVYVASAEKTITGIVRPPRGKRPFSPMNYPEKNIWFYEDVSAMGASLGVTPDPMIVEQTGERKAGIYPAPGDGKTNLRNDHFGYAITWFTLMLIGLGMFVLYHRKPGAGA